MITTTVAVRRCSSDGRFHESGLLLLLYQGSETLSLKIVVLITIVVVVVVLVLVMENVVDRTSDRIWWVGMILFRISGGFHTLERTLELTNELTYELTNESSMRVSHRTHDSLSISIQSHDCTFSIQVSEERFNLSLLIYINCLHLFHKPRPNVGSFTRHNKNGGIHNTNSNHIY